MGDFRARLFTEHAELHQRIEELTDFIAGDKYDTLPEIDRVDLKKQLKHMKDYLEVLNRRVSRSCD